LLGCINARLPSRFPPSATCLGFVFLDFARSQIKQYLHLLANQRLGNKVLRNTAYNRALLQPRSIVSFKSFLVFATFSAATMVPMRKSICPNSSNDTSALAGVYGRAGELIFFLVSAAFAPEFLQCVFDFGKQ
jgi:hypothetical protein